MSHSPFMFLTSVNPNAEDLPSKLDYLYEASYAFDQCDEHHWATVIGAVLANGQIVAICPPDDHCYSKIQPYLNVPEDRRWPAALQAAFTAAAEDLNILDNAVETAISHHLGEPDALTRYLDEQVRLYRIGQLEAQLKSLLRGEFVAASDLLSDHEAIYHWQERGATPPFSTSLSGPYVRWRCYELANPGFDAEEDHAATPVPAILLVDIHT